MKKISTITILFLAVNTCIDKALFTPTKTIKDTGTIKPDETTIF